MKKTISFLLALLYFCLSHANNLQIGPVTLTTANGSKYLNFTIGWNNSWRVTSGPGNWDAVWIFVKRRDCSALDWRHVNLAAQDTAHTAGTPLFVDAYSDKKGVMVYRAADGSGSISNVNIQLKLDSVPAGNYDYQVFGIEMAYVPQGSFYVGDGVSDLTFQTGSTLNPYLITGETSIILSGTGNNLWSNGGALAGTIPALYPKGFKSFYCMKYELSQGQYADFLNNIAQDAAINRFSTSYFNQYRHTINGIWPQITATSPNRACGWLNFKDLTAYFDWSALSPMTELEYEKACRGTGNIPLAGEFAWGSLAVSDADSILAGTDGFVNEGIFAIIPPGSGLANYGNNTIFGPLRCGFAAKANTSRFEAGAAFYGIMELSGNLYERCYNVYSEGGALAFDGSHGDGELSTTPLPGFANQAWPFETGPYNFNSGEGISVAARGGSWFSPNTGSELRVSDRTRMVLASYSFYETGSGRSAAFGGRGVSRRQQ
jgi:formylglycine-generating enzyme required for sulfatase activity